MFPDTTNKIASSKYIYCYSEDISNITGKLLADNNQIVAIYIYGVNIVKLNNPTDKPRM